MALDNAKNFAKVEVSTGYDAAATSIVLTTGHGARLPTAPFNVVWWNSTDYTDPSDDPNVEIVRVTAISTDTLTVTRAQESTSASTKNTASKTYKMIAGLTALGANLAVTGPSSAVDNEIARFDGTGGKTLQGYTSGGPTISDTGAVNIGGGTLGVAQLIVKALTGADFNIFLEGTGGVIIPTIGFKHVSDTTGVRVTGDDTGFNYSNIGEGTTLFVKPGYPDSYWKTHGSLAAIFHIQSHDGSSYLDSHVVKGGLNAFGHATPDRLMHPEIADAVTNAISYIQRHSHVSSGTVATGFGVGEEYELENASGTNKVVATVEIAYTDPTNGSEDVSYKVRLMVAGTLTDAFTITSLGVATFAGGIQLAENTSVALDPAGSADGKYSGITVTGTAGYTQAFGDLVYLDPTDSRWEAVDANAASGADGDARGNIGMVVVAGTDGTACTILLHGIIRADANFPAMTVNSPIYASETAGDVTGTQPTTTDAVIRIVGSALTADELYFNPSPNYTTHI